MENIALYINGDNVSFRNIENILKEINTYGKIIISRVYCDWSKNKSNDWLKGLTVCYEINQIQCQRIRGKSSSNIKLCVDLMKDLYTINNISLFYIITCDRDCMYVIPEIKLLNKKFNYIGFDNENISLTSQFNNYTNIENLKDNKQNTHENNNDTIHPIFWDIDDDNISEILDNFDNSKV